MKVNHTDKNGIAKCLSYRNGKRCGRKAKAVVFYRSMVGTGRHSRCIECSTNEDVVRIEQQNDNGFTVTVDPFDSMSQRKYNAR